MTVQGIGKPSQLGNLSRLSTAKTRSTSAENFNGASNFLVGGLEENGVLATAKTAQIFLGLQVQCTQCHNHPFNDWKQDAFWSMNAFFRQTKPTRLSDRGDDMQTVRLDDTDFAGDTDVFAGMAEIAPVDVARHPLAHQDGEPPVPVPEPPQV